MSSSRVIHVGLLLCGSGFAALVYQTAWLRLLRLVFGSSTEATAAVMVVFMGGLGLGSYVLGKVSDRSQRPLALYAWLEGGVTLGACVSPWLSEWLAAIYIRTGGTAVLGLNLATVVRLLLSVLLLAGPTFLMGGTLPAAVRTVTSAADTSRRRVGVLYAVNTLGAVLGVLCSTFFLLENLGTRLTIWLATLLNLLLVIIAGIMSYHWYNARSAKVSARQTHPREPAARRQAAEFDADSTTVGHVSPAMLYAAAFITGFVFLMMELVWYRMLTPLLGGSIYTFGLILAAALFGIGLGGTIYGLGSRLHRPTLRLLALTCALQALLLLLPYALGDRLAYLAHFLRPLSAFGFTGLVLGWVVIVWLTVLPVALIAGLQFPMLIGLLGQGTTRVGDQIGKAYACNTQGSILGSLLGGFGMMPLLSAPGTWRFAAFILLALALLLMGVSALREGRCWRLAPAFLIVLLTIGGAFASGPSAIWRHGGIGGGRLDLPSNGNRNSQTRAAHSHNHLLALSADGVESAIGVLRTDGYTLVVDGKSDGNVITDAPNFVFSGLIGAVLHPNPRTALMVGLGTGMAAGWLAEVDGMQRVDVVELEKTVVQVADLARAVNFDVVRHPRVNIIIGDGREYLRTMPQRYDLILSEPSNPYRAGVAALYTTDFYAAASRRLHPHGLFLQWLQGYEVEAQTVRTVMATMAAVFPHVEVWHLHAHDILLVASTTPVQHDFQRAARRTAVEPLRSALAYFWGVSGAVGFYAGYLAGPQLPRLLYEQQPSVLNTDDRTLIEFEFARSAGGDSRFRVQDIQRVAQRLNIDQPPLQPPLDPMALAEARSVRQLQFRAMVGQDFGAPGANLRHAARMAFADGHISDGGALWRRQNGAPQMPRDLAMVSMATASAGDPQALALIERLLPFLPAEALLAHAIYAFRRQDMDEATRALTAAWSTAPGRQWIFAPLSRWLLDLFMMIAERSPAHGRQLFTVLQTALPGESLTGRREIMLYRLAKTLNFPELCLQIIASYEPYPYWVEAFLRDRLACYTLHQDPRAGLAAADLDTYRRQQGIDFDAGLVAASGLGMHSRKADVQHMRMR